MEMIWQHFFWIPSWFISYHWALTFDDCGNTTRGFIKKVLNRNNQQLHFFSWFVFVLYISYQYFFFYHYTYCMSCFYGNSRIFLQGRIHSHFQKDFCKLKNNILYQFQFFFLFYFSLTMLTAKVYTTSNIQYIPSVTEWRPRYDIILC